MANGIDIADASGAYHALQDDLERAWVAMFRARKEALSEYQRKCANAIETHRARIEKLALAIAATQNAMSPNQSEENPE